MNRNQRRDIAEHTVEILERGHYTAPDGQKVELREQLDRMRAGTEDFPPDRDIDIPTGTDGMPTIDIRVCRETTLQACRRLTAEGHTPVALNFASATEPGGGFLSGAGSQEESIARASGLYASLLESDMYDYHRDRQLPMYSDWTVYSPKVPVFRDDDGTLLNEPYFASFLTCPAVNVNVVRQQAPRREEGIEEVMDERIDRVLAIAYEKDYSHLVLGAWGCGVFGNDPQVIAELFGEALDGPFRGRFQRIDFAIAGRSGEPNLEAFRQRFG